MFARFILLILFAFASHTAIAERWYEIEVIFFEQANDERLNNESWESQPPLPDLDELQDILSMPDHLQQIDRLCYNNNYYQVKPVPDVQEIVETELVEPSEAIVNQDDNLSTEAVTEVAPIEKPFLLLPDTEHELKDVYAQLRRRRGYRMLFHEAWRQPMQSKSEALPLRFYAGTDYGAKFEYLGELREPPEPQTEVAVNSATPMEYAAPDLIYQQPFKQFRQDTDTHGLMNIDKFYRMSATQRAQQMLKQCSALLTAIKKQQQNPVWQVDGYIKFYAERFRHIETNLSLRMPGMEEVSLEEQVINAAASEATQPVVSQDDTQTTIQNTEDWQLNEQLLTDNKEQLVVMREVLRHYTMQQSRRIVDEKIHYFDHPLLGVIIQMRAYDPEAAIEGTEL